MARWLLLMALLPLSAHADREARLLRKWMGANDSFVHVVTSYQFENSIREHVTGALFIEGAPKQTAESFLPVLASISKLGFKIFDLSQVVDTALMADDLAQALALHRGSMHLGFILPPPGDEAEHWLSELLGRAELRVGDTVYPLQGCQIFVFSEKLSDPNIQHPLASDFSRGLMDAGYSKKLIRQARAFAKSPLVNGCAAAVSVP